MTNLRAFAFGGVCVVIAGCSGSEMPLHPTSPTPTSRTVAAPVVVPPPVVPQQIALGELVEVDLDGTVVSNRWYCEIGEDPMPCAWFLLDVPRAGAVVIRLEFDGTEPMFIQIGNLAIGPDLSFEVGGSPLVASAAVAAGALPFRVGLNVPWGRERVRRAIPSGRHSRVTNSCASALL